MRAARTGLRHVALHPARRAGAARAARGRAHRGARLHDRGGARARGRQEPHGGARRGAGDRRLLRGLRAGARAKRRLRARPARRPAAGLPLAQPQRAEALRRVGRDHALQLPAGARRRAGGGGARHRQHRGPEGRHRHAVGGAPARRLHPRRGLPAGRLQLRDRPRQRRGRGARRPTSTSPALTFTGSYDGGHGAAQADDGRRLAPPLHRRDGRQERLRRDARGRTWSARRWASSAPRSASPVRSAPRSRGSTWRRRVADALLARLVERRAGDPDRRSVPARELDGAGHQPGGRAELRALLRAARGERRPHPRGRSSADARATSPTATSWRPRSPRRQRTIRSSGRRCSSRS